MSTMNLSTIVSGILIGFFIALVFTTSFMDMSRSFGSDVVIDNSSFIFTNSLNTAWDIENKTMSKGISNANTFFPALGTLFDIWNIIKAALQDFTQSIENFTFLVGGHYLLITLKTIIISIIAMGITFIILSALFRGGWKLN